MAANNTLQLTSIDFDSIKNDLKIFLSNQTELGDFNYESSTMQILLNLLAYNTYKNSFYLNMVGNEMFLDSAQIRDSVVSRAKMIGYTPRSARGPSAVVQVNVVPVGTPDTITIARGTRFTTIIDSIEYVFTNPETAVVNANSQGVYSTNLVIKEGRPFVFTFTEDSQTPVEYIIPNDNVDTSSILVRVFESSSNSSFTTWNNATDITAVTSNTNVYFLDESDEGKYRLTFGDNVIGRALKDGNIVEVNYVVCNGTAAEGASVFNVSSIDGFSDVSLQTVESARGGSQQESIASIKFNAPRTLQAQNRAVTAGDYETIIKNNFGDIGAVSVWGGQDNIPQTFGKVFISVKPTAGFFVSQTIKDEIQSFLTNKTILSITPEIVDPTFKFVVPTVNVKYNPNLTTSTAGAVVNGVADAIVQYELADLVVFGKEFVSSELIKNIYAGNDAISSIEIDLRLMKNFIPNTTKETTYRIPFNDPLLNVTGGAVLRVPPQSHPGRGLTVDSSKFTFQGQQNSYFDDDGFGNIRIYYVDESRVRIYTNRLAGTVDYNTGLVVLNRLLISNFEGDALEIFVVPRFKDIRSERNQILSITQAKINLFDTKQKRITSSTANVSTQGSQSTVVGSGVISTVF
jgi:hypothetical protein